MRLYVVNTHHFCTTRKGESHRQFWWRNMKERDHLKELSLDEKILLKGIFKK